MTRQYTGQQALGVGDPLGVGILVGIEAFTLTISEANEALPCAFLTYKTR